MKWLNLGLVMLLLLYCGAKENKLALFFDIASSQLQSLVHAAPFPLEG